MTDSEVASMAIGAMVAVILGVGVIVPEATTVAGEATGPTTTVLELVPILVGVLIITALSVPMMRRMQ